MSDYGRSYEGSLQGEGLSVGIVVSRFNEFICNKLLTGAMDCLNRHGCGKDKLETAWVPGAWETPLVALRMARSGRYDAVLLSLIHISEPTRLRRISYAVFCLKKKKKETTT